MFLSIAARQAVPEDSGGTHPSFQRRSQVREKAQENEQHSRADNSLCSNCKSRGSLGLNADYYYSASWSELAHKVLDKLLHSSGNLAQFPGKKWNYYRSMRYLSVLELPHRTLLLSWKCHLVIYLRHQSGVCFFLSGCFGREDKHVVTKYKVYLCAWKWRVKIHSKFQGIDSHLYIYFLCCYKYLQVSYKLFILSADTLKIQ